jgi:hypothetical protein
MVSHPQIHIIQSETPFYKKGSGFPVPRFPLKSERGTGNGKRFSYNNEEE